MPDPNIDLAFMNGKMHANSLARFQQALLAKVHDVSGAVETSFTPLHKITFTPDTFPIISTVGCCSKQSRAPIVPDLVFARCVSRLVLWELVETVDRLNDRSARQRPGSVRRAIINAVSKLAPNTVYSNLSSARLRLDNRIVWNWPRDILLRYRF